MCMFSPVCKMGDHYPQNIIKMVQPTKEFKIKARACKWIVVVAKMMGAPVWKVATSLLYEHFVGVGGQTYAQDFS